MKKYTFEIELAEGSDEFWEDVAIGGSGCDKVEEMLKGVLAGAGLFTHGDLDESNVEHIDYTIKLTKYENK